MLDICAPTAGIFPHSTFYLNALLYRFAGYFGRIVLPSGIEISSESTDFHYYDINWLPSAMRVIYSTLKSLSISGQRVLVLDGHLYICFFTSYIFNKRIVLTCTEGPDYYRRRRLLFFLLTLCSRRGNKSFVLVPRTPELLKEWTSIKVQCLRYSSWELRSDYFSYQKNYSIEFCVPGQLRREKNLDEIFRVLGERVIFFGTPVRGYSPDIPYIASPSESQFLSLLGSSKFVICTYIDWDAKKESGIFFQALMALTPIITYVDGWLGRNVSEYQIGLTFPRDLGIEELLCSGLLTDENLYTDMLNRMVRLRKTLIDESDLFVQDLIKF